MSEKQVVKFVLFRYKGLLNRLFAFRQMGILPRKLNNIEGLTFFKMLGSGGKNGFSILPNFEIYAFLSVWESEEAFQDFSNNNAAIRQARHKSIQHITFTLKSIASHGLWDGINPFYGSNKKPEGNIAVITRATIKNKFLFKFWRNVKPTSQAMEGSKGLKLSIGIGELPFIQQATFSVWDNQEVMMEFAYKNPAHKDVIKKTRELGWYKEEMFSRFEVTSVEGSWDGFAS